MKEQKGGDGMYVTSPEFQAAVKADVIETSAYITIQNTNYIPSVLTIHDEIFDGDKGQFIGTFIAKYGEMQIYMDEDISLENVEFQVFIGVKTSNEVYEYVPYGTFYIYEVNEDKNDILRSVKFADAKIRFNSILQEDDITYPITVQCVYERIAELAGIQYDDISTLPNADFLLTKEVFWGVEATYSDVIKAIAQSCASFALITRENHIALRWFTQNGVTMDGDTYFTLAGHETYGPINSIVLGRQPQNDNVFLKDDASIQEHGLCELQFLDNPILDMDRNATIVPIFERLRGFSYTPIELEGKGNPSIDAGDALIMYPLEKGAIHSFVLNHQLTFNGAIVSAIESPALTKTQIEYGAADSIEKKILNTELKVDKVKGEITSKVEENQTKIQVIEDAKQYRIQLLSSNGMLFRNGDVQTELKVQVFSWDKDVTEVISQNDVSWKRLSNDETGDRLWNATHNHMKTITLTAEDIPEYASFSCVYKGKYEDIITIANVYDGASGIPGKDGVDGKTTYFHIKYAASDHPADNEIHDTPDKYIGTYVDDVEEDAAIAGAYQWSKFIGDDGVAGLNGQNGKTSYLHIRYSDDGGKTFTSNSGKIPGDYLGQYIDFENKDKETVDAYVWMRIKGEKGLEGPKGADGRQYYTWLKYADTPTSGMSDLPNGKKYIGLAYNQETQEESTIYSAYTWSLIQGEQGVTGPKGADGKQLYTWIKYGTTLTGNNMSDDPLDKPYIGIAYNKDTAVESNQPNDYTWSLIKGEQGPKGENAAIQSNQPPSDKTKLWMDTSLTPAILKQWSGTVWIVVNDFSDQIKTEITESYNSSIRETKEEIVHTVEAEYTKKSETDVFKEYVSTQMSQTNHQFEMTFKTTNELLSILGDKVDTNKEEILKFIRFIDGRIEIGENISNFALIISNKKISFQDNGMEVAYISNSQLVIMDAKIKNSIAIGKFHFVPRTNGNMSIKYIPS